MIPKPTLPALLTAAAVVFSAHAQTPSFTPLAVQPTRAVSAAPAAPAAVQAPQAQPASTGTRPSFQPLTVQPTRQATPVTQPATAVQQPVATQPIAPPPVAVQPSRVVTTPQTAPALPTAAQQPAMQQPAPARAVVAPPPPSQIQAAPTRTVAPAQPVVQPQQPIRAVQPAYPTRAEPEYPVYPETYYAPAGTVVIVDSAWPENKLAKGAADTRDDSSDWWGIGLGPRIGTVGFGADLTVGLLPRLNFRGGFGYLPISSIDPKFGHVKYDMDLDYMTVPLLFDLHPFGTGFRITAGAYILPKAEAKLSATPDDFVQIGSHTYNPSLLGNINGKIETGSSIAPYLGIGYGNAISRDNRWHFAFDLGIVYHKYDVSLSADGTVSQLYSDTWAADLQKEIDALQDDIDKFCFYPVLNIGFTFRF